MKKFTDPHNKHLRRYILLNIIIFILVGCGHLILVIKSFPIVINNIALSLVASYLAVFMSVMMVLMGVYYFQISKK